MRCFRSRAIRTCNTVDALRNEFKLLAHTFTEHGYRKSTVRSLFALPQCKYLIQAKSSHNQQTPKTKPTGPSLTIPFIGEASYRIRNMLHEFGYRVYFSNGTSLSQILYKPTQSHTNASTIAGTRIPNRTGVVYKIDCSDCPAFYIGQTRRDMRSRYSDHMNAIRTGTGDTALSQHALTNSHSFRLSKYLDSGPPAHLPTLEAIAILRNQSEQMLNNQFDPHQRTLPHVYRALMHNTRPT